MHLLVAHNVPAAHLAQAYNAQAALVQQRNVRLAQQHNARPVVRQLHNVLVVPPAHLRNAQAVLAYRVRVAVNRNVLRAAYRTLRAVAVVRVEAAILAVLVAVLVVVTLVVLVAVPVEAIPVAEVAQAEVATPEEAIVVAEVAVAEVAEVTVAADKQLRTV